MKNKMTIFRPIRLIGALVFLMAFTLNIQTSINGEWELVNVGFAQDGSGGTGGDGSGGSGGDCPTGGAPQRNCPIWTVSVSTPSCPVACLPVVTCTTGGSYTCE